jgi:hypothetical protein
MEDVPVSVAASEEITSLDDPFLPSSVWQTIFWVLAFSGVVAASFWWRKRERVRESALPAGRGEVDEWETRQVGRLQRWSQTARQPALTRAYLEINAALRRVGMPPKAGDTAAARAATLSQLIPRLREPIQALTQQYQAGQYAKRKAKQNVSQLTIWRIRWASFWLGLKRRFTSPKSITGRLIRFRKRVNRQFG